MWRNAWLKLILWRKNLSDASKHLIPKQTNESEDKRKQTLRQTSFQELCSIVISEAQPDEDIKGTQETDISIYHVRGVSSDLEVSNTIEHSEELNESAAVAICDVNSPADDSSSMEDIVILENIDNSFQSSPDVSAEVEHIILNSGVLTAVDENAQEYVSAFIEIAVKRFVAEKDPCENKKVAKLQSVAQGHYVTQKTGAFHFIRDMQELFKARQACLPTKKRLARKKLSNKPQVPYFKKKPKIALLRRKPQEPEMSGAQHNQTSVLKLLYNVLAHQLLVSTPEMKPVQYFHVAEQPYFSEATEKPYSLWQWLERWIAHTSSNSQQLHSYNSSEVYEEEDEETNLAAHEAEIFLPATVIPNSNPDVSAIEHEGYQFHTSSDRIKIQIPISSIGIEVDPFIGNSKDQSKNNKEASGSEESITGSSHSSQVPPQSVATLGFCKSGNLELEKEVANGTTHRTFCENINTEEKSSPVKSSRRNQATSRRTRKEKIASLQDPNGYTDGSNGSFGSSLSASFSLEMNETNLVEYPTSHEPGFKLSSPCITEISNGLMVDNAEDVPEIRAPNVGADTASHSENNHSTMINSFSSSDGRIMESNEKITPFDAAHVEQHPAVLTTSSIQKKPVSTALEIGPSSLASSPRILLVMQESQGVSNAENKMYSPPKKQRSPLTPPQSIVKNDLQWKM